MLKNVKNTEKFAQILQDLKKILILEWIWKNIKQNLQIFWKYLKFNTFLQILSFGKMLRNLKKYFRFQNICNILIYFKFSKNFK